jgi:two-component system chemotaxis sensor kinase CheA
MAMSNQAVLNEFVSEAREHLATVSDELLALEHGAGTDPLPHLDRLFRAMHSVKGGAGLIGCRQIGALAHVMETLLDRVRQGKQSLSPSLTDGLLAGNDLLRTLLDDVANSDAVDVSLVLARLEGLQEAGASRPVPPNSTNGGHEPPRSCDTPLFSLSGPWLNERPSDHRFLYTLEVELDGYVRRTGQSVLAFLAALQQQGRVLDGRLQVPDHDLTRGMPEGRVEYACLFSSSWLLDTLISRLQLVPGEITLMAEASPVPPSLPTVSPPVVEQPAESKAATPAAAPTDTERPTSVRINVQILDRLMNLAGELVLVRNQALRTADPNDTRMRQVVQRLNAVTSEVQQAVMLTRLQPVSILFNKFPRLVRDLSKNLGKQIELTLRGTEVELDKAILESLSDPLTHLVRNCCDHGIETPAERIAAGKPPQGHVVLHAHHEGGQIRIEVRDDGRGIDAEKVRRKALEKGLRTRDELAALSPTEVQALILLPGFSTAENVTELSGRGVGMDVVKTNLEQLGGSLQIESLAGVGTCMHLRLPLTLAIIPCLIVTVGDDRYAIAQKDLEELVCLSKEQAASKVEYANDQEFYRLRNRLLPLVRLSEVLSRPRPFNAAIRADIVNKYRRPAAVDATAKLTDHLLSFAVVKVGAERFGLVVDRLLNAEEIVVKPTHPVLKPLRCYSGATIMGDGRVALILDIEGIYRHAGICIDTARPSALALAAEDQREKQTVLLFQYGPREQFAVPLVMVRRIEEIRVSAMEKIGEREFLTIKGQSVRVLRLDRYLSVTPPPGQDTMYLLLPKNLRQPIGILLSRILDTMSLSIQLDTASYREEGVMGTAIVRDRMTLFLDLFRLGDRIEAEDNQAGQSRTLPGSPRRRRILLVEDTQFFRQLVKGYLETEGYEVVTAVNGALGLRELTLQPFDLVVSDIEMPEMDGWGLARAVREQLGRKDLPLLALTTLNKDQDRQKAMECGFNAYEVKVDRESFLASVANLLKPARVPSKGGASHG